MREMFKTAGKTGFQVVLILLFYVYSMGFSGFALYYNWQYAQANGFVKWVCFGDILSIGKAIGWPYFLYSDVRTGQQHEREKAEAKSYADTFFPEFEVFQKQTDEIQAAGKTAGTGPALMSSLPGLIARMDKWVAEDKVIEDKLSNIEAPDQFKTFHELSLESVHMRQNMYRQESALMKVRDFVGAADLEKDSNKRNAEWKVRFDAEVGRINALKF